jgi:hypothetical protein
MVDYGPAYKPNTNYSGLPDWNNSWWAGGGNVTDGTRGGFGPNYGSLTDYGATGQTDWAGRLGMVSEGLGMATSLANIYGMFQSLGLQKKAFKFAQEGTKRNFNAQATGFNNAVEDRRVNREAYAAANPNTDYSSLGGYGGLTPIQEWT